MQKTTLYLPEELHRRLADAARQSGRSQADLLREALERYLDARPRPRFRSVGIVSDGTVEARDNEDWLRREWDRKWERRPGRP